MSTHDPKSVIENVRNHLAAHDRRLVFLFGSGTSSAVNIAPDPPAGAKRNHEPLIPGVEGLTEICSKEVGAMGKLQGAAWTTLVSQCEQAGLPFNVEHILSNLRMKIDALSEGESLLQLIPEELREIERTICAAIAKAACPPKEKIPTQMPHNDFVAWVRKVNRTAPLEVFTTNYDILLERAFEQSRVPIFDAFVGTHQPFFYPECLDDDEFLPRSRWIRLWKLHGSVNWHSEDVPGGKRIIRTQPSDRGEVILPSHRKYDESRKQPYIAYMDRLSRILTAEHALLITCGYSFRDEHINAILYGALDNQNTANIVALQFQELKETDKLIGEALQRSNLTVIGPNGGVIGGRWGIWQLTQPVDKKTWSFMDTAFDSNAQPDDEGSPAVASKDLKGRMRLVDFNWFCRFLNGMSPDSK